jgi:hypothetical protein
MTDIQKEIKEALEKATPGPWIISPDKCANGLIDIHARYGLTAQTDHEDNAHLIANAPTWLLHQQKLIEQLKEELMRKVEGHTYTAQLFSEQMQKNKRLRETLEQILKTPQGEWQATTGQGHAECLKIARTALSSIGGTHEQTNTMV